MRAAALRAELHLPSSLSLKTKRAVLRPVVEGLRRLASLSVAEVDHHDAWQRAAIGVAAVATDGPGLERLLESVRRYLDGRPELELLEVTVSYMDDPL